MNSNEMALFAENDAPFAMSPKDLKFNSIHSSND